MAGGGAITGADFQNVIAEVRPGQDPRQNLSIANISPERRGAENMLEAVHGGADAEVESVA